MAYYIDRDALFSYLTRQTGFRTNCDGCTDIDCLDCIANEGIKRFPTIVRKIPPADVVPVRHGRWDDSGRYRFGNGDLAIRCTGCGCSLREDEFKKFIWNYCPVCGAKMDLKGESEDG